MRRGGPSGASCAPPASSGRKKSACNRPGIDASFTTYSLKIPNHLTSMKTSLSLLLVVLSLAVGPALPLARAADDTVSTKKARPPKEQAAKPDKAVDRLQEQLQQLDLTDEQKVKVDAIIQDEEKAAAALQKDKGVAKEDRKAKVQELRQTTLTKIREVLTPEQRAKLDKHGKGKAKTKADAKAESAPAL